MTQKVQLNVEKENEKNQEIEKQIKSKIDERKIEDLTKKIKEKENELDKKNYLIPGGKDMAIAIKAFIDYEAKWRFTECLGIIEVSKAMNEFITDKKKKELMVSPLVVEALYYFLSKHEATGKDAAEKFYPILKSVNTAKASIDIDRKEYEEMNFRLESLKMGVDPEDSEAEEKMKEQTQQQ